jgi:hypothetical protein
VDRGEVGERAIAVVRRCRGRLLGVHRACRGSAVWDQRSPPVRACSVLPAVRRDLVFVSATSMTSGHPARSPPRSGARRGAAGALHRAGIAVRRHTVADTRLLHDQAWLRARCVDEAQSSTAIAARLGCSPQTVLKALARSGIKTRRPHRPGPSLVDRAAAGGLAAVRHRRRRCSSERCLAQCGRALVGRDRHPPSRRPAAAQGAARPWRAAGESVAAIARRLGASPHRVRVELLRHRLVDGSPEGAGVLRLTGARAFAFWTCLGPRQLISPVVAPGGAWRLPSSLNRSWLAGC